MRIYLLLLIFCYTLILITSASNEAEVDIKDAGVGFINEGDIALMFYITLENKCTEEFEICASMMQCCQTTKPQQSDCKSMYLIGGNMGALYSKKIKNITLIYPNLYLRNRQGLCTVEVKYQNENIAKEITAEIEFKTTKDCDTEQQQCSSVDLDPLQNCNQVDCVIKYSGEFSYFNPNCKECGSVPMCMSDPETCVPQVVYSIATNNCTSLSAAITKNDLQTLEHILEQNQSDEDTGGECGLQRNMVCHHGNMDSNGKCKCHSDWVTTTDDEVYQPSLLLYHMCNIEIGAWNCVNKGRIRTTALLISIFAITIASKILILMCILNWCYKRFRKRTCAPKVDPFDESIILCDAMESFEKCLCEQLGDPTKHGKPGKPGKLKKETVNVSYYPCSPSGFSSVRASTESEKEKYCVKTDKSAVLSNTTSSSVPVSFESETDPTTDDTEEDEDDDNYDIEFVGEGEEEEEEEDEDDCVCDEDESDKDGPKTTGDGSEAQGEEQSEYSVSVVEGSTSTKSKSLSAKTKSSKKSAP